MDRDPHDPEYEPNLEDEREVPIDDDVELELPPATIDPDERVEEDDLEDIPLDDERPV